MSFLEIAQKRCSVRKYLNKVPDESVIKEVLEAGRIAPTAKNFQPFIFIIARDEAFRREIASVYRLDWLLQAPVIIVVCGDHSKSWRRSDGKDHYDIDAAIVIDHITLAAADLGLGTCWICAFDSFRCHHILGLPPHIETIALLPLGYPAEKNNSKLHLSNRKKLEELVYWDGYPKN